MSTPSQAEVRRMIAAAGTIVVKVGSSSLTQPSGHLDPDKLDALAAALAQVRLMGGRVVLVSSGAIAAGFGPLGFDSRPVDVATQQATAAVGQGLLMARYETAFGRFGIRVGQILITAEDTIRATQYRNVERTLDRLLDLGVVPIINENDSLASNEIRFGDNDRLSALVANLVRAEALVLLTDVDALYTAPPSQPGSRRVEYVPNVIDALGDIQVSGSGSKVGTGGMDFAANGGKRQGIVVIMDAELCRRRVHCRQNMNLGYTRSRLQQGNEALDTGIRHIRQTGQHERNIILGPGGHAVVLLGKQRIGLWIGAAKS